MKRDCGVRVMTAAWLLAAASSGNALAQHVVGGMGEPVRMGAFDARGQFEGQAMLAAPVSGRRRRAPDPPARAVCPPQARVA
jgi:hypothetical protein